MCVFGGETIVRTAHSDSNSLRPEFCHIANLQAPTAEYVMGAYHQLWQIERASGCPKMIFGQTDLPPQTRLDRCPDGLSARWGGASRSNVLIDSDGLHSAQPIRVGGCLGFDLDCVPGCVQVHAQCLASADTVVSW
jgi:hypothetical protein